jgi:hypothetical protein
MTLSRVDFATLKTLRVACRQYAYLPALLAEVFQWIRFEASPELVEAAESLDLSCIKPYVKNITVVPTKYSWIMTEDAFQCIIWAPRAEEICDEIRSKADRIREAGGDLTDLPVSGPEEIEKLGLMTFIENHTDGPMPFTHDEIARGYERYMQHARVTHEMFKSKRIDRAWGRVLAQLPDVHLFNIGTWHFDGSTDPDWRSLGCELRIHGHGHGLPGHDHEVCRQLHAPVGEALFRAAVAGFIAARSNISHFEVECVIDSGFTWADDGTLNGLDLSRLQSLIFDPVGAGWWETSRWSREYRATANSRCGLALVTLLNKCSSSLRELTLFPERSGNYFDWPPAAPNRPPRFPALESFTTGTGLDLTAFARFVTQSPALSRLHLDGSEWRGGEWRELWDAIRNHSNRMTLEFEQVPLSDYGEVSVYHHTGEASKADFEEDPWDNIQYSLENYLSGRTHWDRTLKIWFEEGDEFSDSEGSEDDDTESNSANDIGSDASPSESEVED